MKKIFSLAATLLILNSCNNMKNENPLLKEFDTPYQTPPFSKIKIEHYIPAVKESIEESKKNVDDVINSQDKPNFKNVIEALEYSGDRLGIVTSIFFNLKSAHNTKEIDSIAPAIIDMVTTYRNEVSLNEKLFEKIKIVYENKEKENLSSEQNKLLEDVYKRYVRSGINLPTDKKEELKKINKELSELYLKYSKNTLEATSKITVDVTNKEDIEGISAPYVKAAKQEGKDLWKFDISGPTYSEVMKFAKSRDLRKRMNKAYRGKNFGTEFDNQDIVLKIVETRIKKANILGYKTFSDYALENRMAKNKENVLSFLKELLDKSYPQAKKEIKEVEEYAKKSDGIKDFEEWDNSYYSNKLKEQKFNINQEEVKPYFKLENCVNGMFEVANKLYGITFKEVNNIDKYHPDVTTYELYDENNNIIAVFYTDYFPRKEKRSGAWMTSFRGQYKKNGKNIIPQVMIVCNFTKPFEGTPSLLTFDEFTTLFHEFGHALHGMLSNVNYESLSGTSVFRDFVELPSQIMENWCYEKEVLAMIAKNYKTGEVIPDHYIKKIIDAKNFNQGIFTLRQLEFGILDMSWHDLENINQVKSVKEFEDNIYKKTSFFPIAKDVNMSTQFSHIFSSDGYSSGYYSYKWAEVLEADAFAYFKEKGIFNRELAKSFRENILSKGGTEDPMELFVRFRGHKPSINSLLIKQGFLKN